MRFHPWDVGPGHAARPSLVALCVLGVSVGALAQPPAPQFAQPGKDVVWVPSPLETIALMLDLAEVTERDYVIDLGSGDGRTVIAAAQRGATALGVEYNDDLVALSRQEALRAGVATRARFVQGDMYEADVSKATVLALFLLPENLRKLSPTFLALRPGTRIVSNTFTIPGWTPARTIRRDDPCTAWCAVLLYVVPAQVGGTWAGGGETLALVQEAQTVTGTWRAEDGTTTAVRDAVIEGDRLTFTVDATRYEGRVEGQRIAGERTSSDGTRTAWAVTRATSGH